jgi:hypothetical protein
MRELRLLANLIPLDSYVVSRKNFKEILELFGPGNVHFCKIPVPITANIKNCQKSDE